MTSAMFAGDRWVQVQSTGGRLTGCEGGTKAAEFLESLWRRSSTTASQTAAECCHVLKDMFFNTPVILPAIVRVNKPLITRPFNLFLK